MNGYLSALKVKINISEKIKDFRNVVLLQCLIIFTAMLLKPTMEMLGFMETYQLRDSIFLVLGGAYIFSLWDLLRNFIQKQRIIFPLLCVIIFTFILALVVVNPFFKISAEHYQRPLLFIIHFVLFLVEAIVIVYGILDLFKEDKTSKDRLWGAASVYLMISISFASAYDLINIIKPGCMGLPLNLGLESYTECIYYSLSILGGQDSIYDHPDRLIRNLGIVESLWGNLFVVLLVGKILSAPDKKLTDDNQ